MIRETVAFLLTTIITLRAVVLSKSGKPLLSLSANFRPYVSSEAQTVFAAGTEDFSWTGLLSVHSTVHVV